MSRTAILLLAALWSACRHGPPAPIDIEAGDTCSQCRMTISERRYAAELIAADGTALKFDDIGCLARFAHARGVDRRRAAVFVVDYDTGRWIPAARAWYVQSPALHTPMASGIVALETRAAAQRFGARVRAFEELMEP